jgi:two-component system, NarL family, nitrate/nitrite response regulator NarL
MTENEGVIRILLADDHTIFREGLKALISSQPDFKVVGEARDGSEVLKIVGSSQPEILLLDFLMPNANGIEVLQLLEQSHSTVRTIMLSGAMEGEDISKAFELGARGLVLKDTTTHVLFNCIRTVRAGQYWIGRQGVSNLVQALKQYKNSAKKASPKNYGLTPREMEVVKAVASGFSNKEIAGQFTISEQTVKHHITSIFDKLGVYNRLELTLFVIHHDMVEK